jgi:hypothetical protein
MASKKTAKTNKHKKGVPPTVKNSMPRAAALPELHAQIEAAKEIIALETKTETELRVMEDRFIRWETDTTNLLFSIGDNEMVEEYEKDDIVMPARENESVTDQAEQKRRDLRGRINQLEGIKNLLPL